MDLKGLERAVERKSSPVGEREELLRSSFLEHAKRLRMIEEALFASVIPAVNIADLTDSPLGAGRLSAIISETHHLHENPQSNRFRIEYHFTPVIPQESWRKGMPIGVQAEKFDYRDPVQPQLDAMVSTVEMLEAAIMTDGLDNEDLRSSYEALIGAQA